MDGSPQWQDVRMVRGLIRMTWIVCCLLACAAWPVSSVLLADDVGVQVPDGFEVVEFASDELVHDVYSMTIDSVGRVVAAGAGYVKILVDTDEDGRADSAKLFSELPRNGAQGMYFQGRTLICIGDGGLLRLKDADGDDRADGPPELFLKLKTGGEHDVHSVQLGPDGWWYVIAGNNAGVNAKYATLPTSPIKVPRAGAVFRLKPDVTGGEILADGLRNAYDFAFNPQGDLFLYDSDEEREISLPWYRPIRVYHALTGADHGWVSKSWMRRDGYFDMPPTIASLGRGSPTGVACYRHQQFPEKYRGGLFVLDWTYGRVHAVPLEKSSDTWKGEPELFMSATGQNGFAPTDVEVGPDGSLYVSVGGRGTRGGIYRVRHRQSTIASGPPSPAITSRHEKLLAVLDAPQPLSSWSRARWRPVATELGADPFQQIALAEAQSVPRRIRALEILVELFQGLDAETATTLQSSRSEEVRARAIWAHGRSAINGPDPKRLATALADASPLVARSALETLLTVNPDSFDWAMIVPRMVTPLNSPHRFVRTLAANVVSRLSDQQLAIISAEATKAGPRAVISYAFGWLGHSTDKTQRIRSVIPRLAISVLSKPQHPTELKLDAVRLLQLAFGDMGPDGEHPPAFDGYAPQMDLDPFERELDPLRVQLAECYPSGDAELDRELERLLAMVTTFSTRVADALCDRLTEDSHPVDDIHHLIVLARCPMTHTVKQRDRIVRSLVELDERIARLKLAQDASWSDRVKEMWIKLALADKFLAPAVVSHPKFGRPGHTIFLNELPPELLPVARDGFARQIAADANYPWNNDVVFALGESDQPQHQELVRQQFENFSVRGAVLVLLSRNPQPADRTKFVAGLDWSQTEVQAACLSALEQLPPSQEGSEQIALLKAARRLGNDEAEYAARERAVKLLERNNQRSFSFVTGKAGYRPQPEPLASWTTLLEKRYPAAAASDLGGNSGELDALKAQLSHVDWNSGSTARGATLFDRRGCRQCHSGRSALGPDLAGAAGRFSREDLFTAIVLPSRDVSNRYQTTTVVTKDGRSYSGLIIYESVDGFLLRNSTGQTFRIETSQVDVKRKSPVSLMPTNLLKDFTAADYADLYAYLKSLNSK